jgi:hypothetical protein
MEHVIQWFSRTPLQLHLVLARGRGTLATPSALYGAVYSYTDTHTPMQPVKRDTKNRAVDVSRSHWGEGGVC